MRRDVRQTVNAALGGDADALESLFERSLPRLRAFIRMRMGRVVAARESVTDLAQSVCREVLQDLDRFEFRTETEFRSYLFLRATRKILKRARFHHRAKRDLAREVAMADAAQEVEAVLHAFGVPDAPTAIARQRELGERLQAAISSLPDAQRDAVTLAKLMGMSYSDIAAEMDTTESAVRGLVARGVAKLAPLLAEGTLY